VRSSGKVLNTFLLCSLAIGCSESPGAPPPEPPRVESLTLSATTVAVDDGGTAAITATVRDQRGNAMTGQTVVWTSDDASVATVTHGTISGVRPGTAQVTASSGNRSASAAVTVKSVATMLQAAGGSEQEARVGEFVADSIRVRAIDRHGEGVAGVAVQFVVVAGDGVVSSASVTTAADGYAATRWMLGPNPGQHMLEARAAGLSGSPVSFAATALASGVFLLGDTVSGSVAGGVVAQYRFVASAGQEVNVFFQQLAGTHELQLHLVDRYGTPESNLISTVNAAVTADLHQNHSGRRVLPRTDEYTILVTSCCGAIAGTYRFQVFPINRAPEGQSAAVAVGDTVVGELFPKGDIDEFTFAGTEGQQVNVFFQRLDGPSPLDLYVYDTYGTPQQYELGDVRASDVTSDLHDYHTGRITLPRNGTYTVVVAGMAYGSLAGRYRFQVFPVDPAPESVPAVVEMGDTVAGERIAPKGDVDTFTFMGSAGQDINVFFQQVDGSGPLLLTLHDRYGMPGGSQLASVASAVAPQLDTNHTGRRTLPWDGEYTLVVEGQASGSHATGGYRFQVARIDHAPEHVASQIAVGDTITGEAIFPKGDVDRFTFQGAWGQEVALFLQPYGGSGELELKVIDLNSLTGQLVISSTSATDTADLEQFGTGWFSLTNTGTFAVVVTGGTPDAVGTYRLHLRTR
jgi:hypothetical protein